MKYIPQIDETDCGVACLAMIASHYRHNLRLSSLREVAGTDRQGTNLAGMVKACKAVGLDCKALRGDASALSPEVPVPFVAHISKKTDQGNLLHFVVVRRISAKTVEVWDPDITEKKKLFPLSTFLELWTGYVLFISPSKDFVPAKGKGNLFAKFLPLLSPHKGTFIMAGLASILLVAFGIISALYTRYIIDEVLFSQARFTLMALSIGMLVMVVTQAVMGCVRNLLLTHVAYKIDLSLVFSYFAHILHLPLSFFDSRKTGEILSRLEDVQKIRAALSQASLTVVMDSLMIAAIGPVLFATNSTLFAILVITVPLSAGVMYLFSRLYRHRFRLLMSESAEVQSYLVESVNGMGTVKALNAQDQVFQQYEQRHMKAVWSGWKASRLGIFHEMTDELIQGLGGAALFWLGSLFIIDGTLSLGVLISFTALAGYFTGPLQRLVNLQASLQEAFVAADRLGEILELDLEQGKDQRLIKPASFLGRIEAKGIGFRYGTRKPVYDKLDFKIEPGEWVAFVGPSGCGKTTLIKLLLKFYEPEQGELLIDGHNSRDLDAIHLRSRVGYVPQEIFLFSGTIADNIALHVPDASLEDIVAAAQKTGAHDFIVNLPDRYQTVLGERGATLSGGERQRLALTRALLGKPEILIFDEATSNLDSLSEGMIHRTIESLRDQRVTTILIAHRLSTVIACDRIFVMEEGRVVEEGSHRDLLASEGLYHALWQGVTV